MLPKQSKIKPQIECKNTTTQSHYLYHTKKSGFLSRVKTECYAFWIEEPFGLTKRHRKFKCTAGFKQAIWAIQTEPNSKHRFFSLDRFWSIIINSISLSLEALIWFFICLAEKLSFADFFVASQSSYDFPHDISIFDDELCHFVPMNTVYWIALVIKMWCHHVPYQKNIKYRQILRSKILNIFTNEHIS